MDRDPNDLSTSPNPSPGNSGLYGTGGTGGTAGTTGTSGNTGRPGATGATTPVRGADMPSGGATASGMQGSLEQGVDRASDAVQEKLGDAREQLGDTAERARGWKRTMEQKLADRLHDGASKLREKANSMPSTGGSTGAPAYAGAAAGSTATAGGAVTGSAVSSAAVADRARSVEQNLARGMDATADWLRNGDLQTTVEEQARSNPARTLLIALGVGYLLGKTLKR